MRNFPWWLLAVVALLACGSPSSTDGGTGGGSGGGAGGGAGGGTGGGAGGGSGGGTGGGGGTDAGFDAGVDAGVQDAGCVEVDLEDGGCLPLGFSNICQLRALTVLLDGLPVDDTAGNQMAQALVDHCTPPPSRRSVPSIDPSVVSSSGAPVVGRDQSLVCGGGSFFQKHVEWLEAGPAPVIDTTTSQFASVQRRDGGYVFIEPRSAFDGGFDYFVVELVRSQPTGPLSLVGYGLFVEGTRAVGWYFANRVATNPATYPDAWYVVKWSDLDHDGMPGAADSYTIQGSGR